MGGIYSGGAVESLRPFVRGDRDSNQSESHYGNGEHRWCVREPVKSALFADKPDRREPVQSYERLMGGAAMITVRSFDTRNAAAGWLEVPLLILMPPAAV